VSRLADFGMAAIEVRLFPGGGLSDFRLTSNGVTRFILLRDPEPECVQYGAAITAAVAESNFYQAAIRLARNNVEPTVIFHRM
jgi:hypothetical protein